MLNCFVNPCTVHFLDVTSGVFFVVTAASLRIGPTERVLGENMLTENMDRSEGDELEGRVPCSLVHLCLKHIQNKIFTSMFYSAKLIDSLVLGHYF